jgi:hypothetical protein
MPMMDRTSPDVNRKQPNFRDVISNNLERSKFFVMRSLRKVYELGAFRGGLCRHVSFAKVLYGFRLNVVLWICAKVVG